MVQDIQNVLKNYGMHILQRMYSTFQWLYLPTITVVTYLLVISGGELALAIYSATLSPPATDGPHPKNVELILRLVDFYAFIDAIMLDTASIKY